MIIFDKHFNRSQNDHRDTITYQNKWFCGRGGLKYWLKWHIISYILRSETHRREEAFSRRHVDGTFTSDVNKVLDSMAAKEYLLWVMTSKPSGER